MNQYLAIVTEMYVATRIVERFNLKRCKNNERKNIRKNNKISGRVELQENCKMLSYEQ